MKIHFIEKAAIAGSLAYNAPIIPVAYGAYKAYKAYRAVKKFDKANPNFKKFVAHSIPIAVSRSMAPIKRKAQRQSYPSPSKRSMVKMGSAPRSVSVGTQTYRKGRYALVPPRYPRRPRRNGGRGKYLLKKKKFRMKLRKMKTMRNSVKDAYYKGTTIRNEYGAVTTDNYCLYVGHTLPTFQMRRNFFSALVKALLVKCGMNPINFDQANPIQGGLPVGDAIYIYYRRGLNIQSAAEVSVNYVFVASETVQNIITKLMEAFDQGSVTGSYEDIRFESIRYYPSNIIADGQDMSINLVGSKVSFYFDSVMKMQNRTADSATNTQADDLVAQHVVGKSYYGYGLGTDIMMRAHNTGDFQASLFGSGNGSIGASNFSSYISGYVLKEPPPKNHLSRCLTSNNVRFAPSELKKSVLSYKNVLPIDVFWKDVCRDYQSGVPNSYVNPTDKRYGKWRVFAIEKEIETVFGSAIEPSTPVKFGIEVNNTTGVTLMTKRQSFTVRENWIGCNLPSYP